MEKPGSFTVAVLARPNVTLKLRPFSSGVAESPTTQHSGRWGTGRGTCIAETSYRVICAHGPR